MTELSTCAISDYLKNRDNRNYILVLSNSHIGRRKWGMSLHGFMQLKRKKGLPVLLIKKVDEIYAV
jgi:hypothetical protein